MSVAKKAQKMIVEDHSKKPGQNHLE